MVTTEILNLAPYIDHTLLKPEASKLQIEQLCREAIDYGFKGVCVNSRYISLANTLLGQSDVLIVSVIGFPLGACLSEAKRDEAQWAASHGADEIDMVISLGAIKDKDWKYVERDIRAVTEGVSLPVKVILETGLLTKEEIVQASKVSEAAGARFVKTCTGFAAGAATVEDVALMRATVSEMVEVKASGGIKTFEQARALILAGATRLGTSSGVQLVTGQSVAPHVY